MNILRRVYICPPVIFEVCVIFKSTVTFHDDKYIVSVIRSRFSCSDPIAFPTNSWVLFILWPMLFGYRNQRYIERPQIRSYLHKPLIIDPLLHSLPPAKNLSS